MTADEIRKSKFVCDDGAWETARWLQEIAAQLAEFNAKLDAAPGQPVRVVIGTRNA